MSFFESLDKVQKGNTSLYARVTTLQLYPEKMEEGVKIAREMAVPDIEQQQASKASSP